MGSENSHFSKEVTEPLNAGDSQALAIASGGCVDFPPSTPRAKPSAEYRGYFDRFAGRDGLVSLRDFQDLAATFCHLCELPELDPGDVARAFGRHCGSGAAGLPYDAFAACCDELLAWRPAAQPELAVPSAEAVVGARRLTGGRLLLHTELPTRTLSLHSMGAVGVSITIAEVVGLPGNVGPLRQDERLHCRVMLQRRGRLLPRKASRTTAVCESAGLPGAPPVWRFREELLFDDAALLGRRGELSGTVLIKNRGPPFFCSLAVTRSIPIPTQGVEELPLVDPTTGRTLGSVKLRSGWPCSEGLAEFTARQLRRCMDDGRWTEARAVLGHLQPEPLEYVGGRCDAAGQTLLMTALQHGEVGTALVRDLLAVATPAWFAVDSHGATAVHHAAFAGSFEALAALLGCGLPADSPARGLLNATPLMLAALRGSQDHVRLLLGFGARADRVDATGLPVPAWPLGLGPQLLAALSDWPWRGGARPPLSVRTEASAAVLPLLVEELWRCAPPLAPPAAYPMPALRSLWLPLVRHAADCDTAGSRRVGQERFLQLLSAELGKRCGVPQRHQLLLASLFAEAVAHRYECLAVRLVSDLGALTGGYTATALAATAAAPLLSAAPAAAVASCSRSRAVVESSSSSSSPAVADTVGDAEVCLEAALDAGLARLARVLLVGHSGRLGSPSRAVRLLRLAAEHSETELRSEVLKRLPTELTTDPWTEPMALGTNYQDCPVCLQPLALRKPMALCKEDRTARGPRRFACTHFVCESCSQQVNSRCPLCRTEFGGLESLPNPSLNPLAWFNVVVSFANAQATHAQVGVLNTSDDLVLEMERRPTQGTLEVSDNRSCASMAVAVKGDSDPQQHRWTSGHISLSGANACREQQPHLSFTRADLENMLPATMPVDPRLFSVALDAGLWDAWDVDGDGRISVADFFEPQRGLLRWLIVHQQPQEPFVDFETESELWLTQRLVARQRSAKDSAEKACVFREDALGALLQLTSTSFLDEEGVGQLRAWLSESWRRWAVSDTACLSLLSFSKPGGAADALVQHARWTLANRAVARLSGEAAEAGQQVEALYRLFSFVLGRNWSLGAPDGEAGSQSLTISSIPDAAQVVSCAQRMRAFGQLVGERRELLRQGIPCALAATKRYPNHPQVVGWAARLCLVILLGLCSKVAELCEEDVSWPQLIRAAGAGHLRADFENACGTECPAQDLAASLVQAVVRLSMSPRGAADQTFMGTVASVALVLWCLDASCPDLGVPRLLCELHFKGSMPALRSFACVTTLALFSDVEGVSRCLRAWGHSTNLLWSPPSTLPPSQVSVGQEVEVCAQNGWLQGVVRRTPAAQPTTPRDECWHVYAEGDARIYSRHIWAPGWRAEAAKALDRIQAAVLARASCPPRCLGVDTRTVRRALLDGVLVHGLAPRAVAAVPSPQGPVLRGSNNCSVQVGDQVWLSITVERAKSLQTPRHGDWADQRAFCLDCPGRVVETLSAPPRARVSHGSLGSFLWNPLAVTRSVSTAEPLPFEEQHGPIVVGDEVLLCASQDHVVPLQFGHGGWSTRMAHGLGRYGRVTTFYNRGDVRLDVPGCGPFVWNPAVIEPPGRGCVTTLCAQAMSRLDDEGAAMVLLLLLSELSDSAGAGDEEAVRDVFDALDRSMREVAGGTLPSGLRAYGALALLAATVDLRRAFCNGLPGPPSSAPERPPAVQQVLLPACAPKSVLELLKTLPAMDWPAADLGGVGFREVVAGEVDVLHAAGRWILAFFSSRHRRLLETKVA